jgi:hypothetical protein
MAKIVNKHLRKIAFRIAVAASIVGTGTILTATHAVAKGCGCLVTR